MAHIDMAECRSWIADALMSAGVSAAQAESVAWGLVEAEAGGISTHGIVRTLQYVDTARAGGVTVNAVPEDVDGDDARLLIDARGGYGFLPMRDLIDRLIDRARERGIAMGAVRNSHHYGAGWLYATRVARAGLGAFVMTNASANLAGPGASSAVMGNNPLSIALPGPEEFGPVCSDLAMSVVAQGHIRMAARLGESIPEGWARAADGSPTTDADAALAAGLLEPIGGHKGFVIATLIELLGGALTGSPFGRDSVNHSRPEGGVGHFAIVFDPDRFLGPDTLAERVRELHAQVVEAAGGAPEATMPGWREEARRRTALVEGLPVKDAILERLAALDEAVRRPLPTR